MWFHFHITQSFLAMSSRDHNSRVLDPQASLYPYNNKETFGDATPPQSSTPIQFPNLI